MDSVVLRVAASADHVRSLLLSSAIQKRWSYVVDEDLEREWIVMEDEDDQGPHSGKLSRLRKPSAGLSLCLHNMEMGRQWPPPFEFCESSVEDLHLCSQFVVSPSPFQPSRFSIVEWFSADLVLVHVALISPISPTLSEVTFRYEYFLPEHLERSESHFRNEMNGYWRGRFLRLFRGVEWEYRGKEGALTRKN
jgi:hypothetical protein